MKLKELLESKIVPVTKIYKPNKDYNVFSHDINSLEGCPDRIDGDFSCGGNLGLKTLKGGPSYVKGSFTLSKCGIADLSGAPQYVGSDFAIYGGPDLKTLVGGPQKVGGNMCVYDCGITDLRGAPHTIGFSKRKASSHHASAQPGYVSVTDCQLTSLEGAPRRISGLNVSGNNIKSLKGVHKMFDEINGEVDLSKNPLTSHVVGLLSIKGITKITLSNKRVNEILNRHVGNGLAGFLQAQEELEEAGLGEFAQL